MTHFERKPDIVTFANTSQTSSDCLQKLMSLRIHRTVQYASFTLLAFRPNCAHIQKSLVPEEK